MPERMPEGDTEREYIELQGFAIVPNVFSPGLLEETSRDLSQTVIRRGRAGVRHGMHLPPVRKLARGPQLIALARHLLGPEAFPYRATIFEKTPTKNWLIVWHQDTALPLEQRRELPGWGPWSVKDGIAYAHAPSSALEQVLALRIHFDDSTSENGPLRVLPGTHRLGVLSDDQIHDLSHRNSAVDCIVPKAGVIAMRPLLVHASSKVQNGMARRVMHIEYAASEAIASPLRLALA